MPRTTQSATTLGRVLGEQVRTRRRQLGMTQADVAMRLDVSSAYVQKVEAGRANITLGQMERIVAALDAYLALRVVPLETPELDLPNLELSSVGSAPGASDLLRSS